ncbi:hypothetical protein A2Y99_03850 [Candidatus Gottesmanbacteria bacterium RBG_13_37_7]|uniref:Phosphatidic acid phosphatase type 2/haloperoxidase domain-containing protein n=1 Tax=Candidatus Gottesmanbacteria bacterium RBG_13_37_7 TaxID=1798369 RepID=A0A1F5YHE1_9BACT|nr:MAG: hypothetical protein A2Y99_03850 [Candidatus Gottesmanbacteria bacterium RBG_13_37_7]
MIIQGLKVHHMLNKSKKNYLITGIASGFIFLVLTFLVNMDIFRSIDYQTTVLLQEKLNRIYDFPFSLITLLGSSEVITLLVAGLFLWDFYKFRKIRLGLFLYLSVYLIEILGKKFIFHPDPPMVFNRVAIDFNFPSSNIIRTGFSYPSGHMARSIFLLIIILFMINRYKKRRTIRILSQAAGYFLICAIFISRIYLGEHWFSDVAGGILLGMSLATFSLYNW